MNTVFRVTSKLLDAARTDLRRRHVLAAERVGFMFCRAAALDDGLLVLAEEYEPVANDHYIEDELVGARINSAAIRNAMERSLGTGQGVFHIHLHGPRRSPPVPSPTDWREWKKFVPDFFNTCPKMPHGAIIANKTSIAGWCWCKKTAGPLPFRRTEVVGMPLQIGEVAR